MPVMDEAPLRHRHSVPRSRWGGAVQLWRKWWWWWPCAVLQQTRGPSVTVDRQSVLGYWRREWGNAANQRREKVFTGGDLRVDLCFTKKVVALVMLHCT